jgi:hypothetical protein
MGQSLTSHSGKHAVIIVAESSEGDVAPDNRTGGFYRVHGFGEFL